MPSTKKLTTEEFILRAKSKHGDRYDYSKVSYVNDRTKVTIICPLHGEFRQLPSAHLRGQGCPKCSGRTLSREEVIERFKKVHGDEYDYSKFEFNGMHVKSTFICKEHGEFQQTPSKHMNGQGCPLCAVNKRSEKHKLDKSAFIHRANLLYNYKYDYSNVDYKSMLDKVIIVCGKHGAFLQRPNDHLQGHGCPICGKLVSSNEMEILEYIINKVGKENVIHNDRRVLDGKEIDILLPYINIGIEYNGLRWHSESFGKDKQYHINKFLQAEEKGINLLQFFEDEYMMKKEQVLNVINKAISKEEEEIDGFEIKTIEKPIAKEFMDKNWIEGYRACTVCYGCYHHNELIACSLFKRKNLNCQNYELKRYFCKISAKNEDKILKSMVLKLFLEENAEEIEFIVDNRFNIYNNVLERVGFKRSGFVPQDYYYIDSANPTPRIPRHKMNKKTISFRYNLPYTLSEKEMAIKLGYERIWDCGKTKYKIKKP